MKAVKVKIQRRATTEREWDAICVVICDLHLSCDLVSDRQIKLAKALADDHQATFSYDDVNANRVRSVLGIHE